MGLIIPRSWVRNPPEASFCIRVLLWRSWQRSGLMSRWPRVRAPAGASLCFVYRNGWMAEWSKALVLGTSLFGGVGSNPTSVTFAYWVCKMNAPAGARTLGHRLIRPERCQLRHKSYWVCNKECLRWVSNPRPWDYETHALPTAPQRLKGNCVIRESNPGHLVGNEVS